MTGLKVALMTQTVECYETSLSVFFFVLCIKQIVAAHFSFCTLS